MRGSKEFIGSWCVTGRSRLMRSLSFDRAVQSYPPSITSWMVLYGLVVELAGPTDGLFGDPLRGVWRMRQWMDNRKLCPDGGCHSPQLSKCVKVVGGDRHLVCRVSMEPWMGGLSAQQHDKLFLRR